MPPRTRTQNWNAWKGNATFNSGVFIGGGLINIGQDVCTDNTDPGDCHAFTVNRYYQEGGRMNYRADDENDLPWWNNYLADGYANNANWLLQTGFGEETNASYAARAAARTNPSRPYVDIPVTILELGDILQLLRDTGRRSFARHAGAQNLSYQFGVAPLASDMQKLLSFQEQLNRRVKEIVKLGSPRGLRRTVSFGKFSKIGTVSRSLQSNGTSMTSGNVPWTSTCLIKAHVRWRAVAETKTLVAEEGLREIAKRAVLGLTIDASTAWEAIPWSWLIDWGTNVGTFLKANRNIIPAELLGVHVVKHTRTVYRNGPRPFMSGEAYCGAWKMEREQKLRSPTPVTLTAHFPFLSGKQMGIVASLAVTRR